MEGRLQSVFFPDGMISTNRFKIFQHRGVEIVAADG